MAIYELVISRSVNLSKTVAIARSFSAEPISALRAKIGTEHPLVSVSSSAYPVGSGSVEGARMQHLIFMQALDAFLSLGDLVEFRYRPSEDYPREAVDEMMIRNLMQSELESRAQEYD